MVVIFWSCAAIAAFTYVGYPLLVGVWARLRPRPVRRGPFDASVSFVLAVHNEEERLARRLDELCGHLQRSNLTGEILVVVNGSTDRSAAVARGFEASGLIRVIDLKDSVGKAAALTAGCQLARHDVLVFGDVRQTWAEDALVRLLENFADPEVGAVSGDLVLETNAGVVAGVGLYWRFEKWLRQQESRVWSQVGVTGAISAVRRTLFRPIPPGTLLDDVHWPLEVAMQGHRVVHDARARAFDRLPEKSSAEFRRKVRTLAGNFQLLTRLPAALLPWRNPVWFAWLSHKLLRLAVPWALLGMLVSSVMLADEPLYRVLLVAQVGGYGLGVLGAFEAAARRAKILSAAGSFLVLNAAAWLAFWVWISGRAGLSWRKVDYRPNARVQSLGERGALAP